MPIVAVVAIDEGGAEPPQQKAGDRHAAHLMLDQIREAGRQRGRQDDAVEIARVIRDDDARVRWLYRIAFDADGAADRDEEEPRGASSEAPAAVEPRRDGEDQAQREDDGDQGHPGVAAIGEMNDAT